MAQKVVIIHYRTGERDGVSLEIEKRAKILSGLGSQVLYVTGNDGLNRENAIVIPELDIQGEINLELMENCFDRKKLAEDLFIKLYRETEEEIYRQLHTAFNSTAPGLVFVHNLFSLPYNLPATTALLKVLDEMCIPTVAVHHDLWFSRSRYTKPAYDFIKSILNNLPPNKPYIIKHQAINSIEAEEIRKRRNITVEQIGDYFDFNQTTDTACEMKREIRTKLGIKASDTVVLHATRITARKAIENAIIFTAKLDKYLHGLNGSKAVLLLPNFVEVDSGYYLQKLKNLCLKLGARAIWAADYFLPERTVKNGRSIYSLWDAYSIADLITYTSTWEGFGNQFLEAAYFKKLPVLYEYPVFGKDIKREGYRYVSLGKTVVAKDGFYIVPEAAINKAVKEIASYLADRKKIEALAEHNFVVGKKYHDTELLEKDLKAILSLSAGWNRQNVKV